MIGVEKAPLSILVESSLRSIIDEPRNFGSRGKRSECSKTLSTVLDLVLHPISIIMNDNYIAILKMLYGSSSSDSVSLSLTCPLRSLNYKSD